MWRSYVSVSWAAYLYLFTTSLDKCIYIYVYIRHWSLFYIQRNKFTSKKLKFRRLEKLLSKLPGRRNESIVYRGALKKCCHGSRVTNAEIYRRPLFSVYWEIRWGPTYSHCSLCKSD